jgi:hypothetical protein
MRCSAPVTGQRFGQAITCGEVTGDDLDIAFGEFTRGQRAGVSDRAAHGVSGGEQCVDHRSALVTCRARGPGLQRS